MRRRIEIVSRVVSAVVALIATVTVVDAQGYQAVVDNWVRQDGLDPLPKRGVVVTGSSSVRLWERLTLDFAEWNVIQRGFGGSQFSDLNQYVDELVLAHDPACIVVFEGANDTAAGKTPAEVFADYLTFVDHVRAGEDPAHAPTPIVYIGITPTPARWSIWSTQSQVNALVQAHAASDPSLHYADVPTAFLATGSPPASSLFLSDGLHLNKTGYALWTSVILPVVRAAHPDGDDYARNPLHPTTGARVLVDFGPLSAPVGGKTPSPDANGNHWNNWYGVAQGSEVLAGEHRGALVATDGSPTGFGIVMSGEMTAAGDSGFGTPSAALLGLLAVGTATGDYFHGDDQFKPAGVMLRGLDPTRSYELRLFASRDVATRQETRYVLFGRGTRSVTLVTSGAGIGSSGGNANDDEVAVFEDVRSDPLGRIWIDHEVVAGRAFLSLIELVVGPHVEKDHKVRPL